MIRTSHPSGSRNWGPQLGSGPHSALIYFHQQVLESFPEADTEADILLLKFRRFERKSSRTGL
jgi:hypothetical protein